MSAVTSKAQICNIALGQLGNRGSVENIDTPRKPQEIVFAKWYDLMREVALKEQKPNFSIERRVVAEDSSVIIPFGYSKAYEYPADCLHLLGIGDVEDKFNNHAVEGNVIYTVDDGTNTGLNIRFIKDITDVSQFSSEFVMVLATMLAEKACYEVTEDDNKKQITKNNLRIEKASAASLSGQENRPIRINNSKFKASRTIDNPQGAVKL